MRRYILLFLLSFLFLYSKEIRLSEEQMKLLGIKIQTVRQKPAEKVLRLPAQVSENPKTVYKVHSPVNGIVEKVYKFEGDYVKKGEVLLEIFSPEIVNLLGEIEQTKTNLDAAKKVYEKYKELYKQRIIRYTKFYESQVEYERLKGIYEALVKKLRSYGEIKGKNLLIKSPGEGYITLQRVVVGESVELGKPLYEIHLHRILWVYGWASEGDLEYVRNAKRIEVLKDNVSIPCKLEYVDHKVDPETRKVKVRCSLRNKGHHLLPNMFVEMKVYTGESLGIVIPKKAVKEIEGENIVFVYKDGKFIPREVAVIRDLGSEVLVEGLREGEKIAVEGVNFLKVKLVGLEEGGHAH